MAVRRAFGIAVVLVAAGTALGFSHRPGYLDPRLGGWKAPLETLCFQAGCGQLYYVAGVWLEDGGRLRVLSRSKVTLRRFDRRALGRFARALAGELAPVVEAMAEREGLEEVVLTFYCPRLRGNLLTLQVFECRLPAEGFASLGPIPLEVVERREEVLPPP